MARIVTVTLNPSVDRSCRIEQVIAERKLRCQELRHDPGGGGINVARAAKELGAECLALWLAGGAGGARLRQLLEAIGLPHEPLEIAQPTRESLTVVEEGSGQQFRFLMPGPTLNDEEQQRCRARIIALAEGATYLVLSGSLPPGVPTDFLGQVAHELRGTVRVIVDTSEEALQQVAERGAYLLKPNLRELSQLTGRELDNEAAISDAAQELVARGAAEVVVVSLGSAGALFADSRQVEQVRSPTVPQRSKVGAGDSMVGGLVTALARGESLAEAVRWGIAAGAAAVMTPGTGLCRREDVESLRQRITW